MSSPWSVLDPTDPGWHRQVAAFWEQLDPRDGLVVPDYFVKTTFAKIGGRLAVDRQGSLALLFPRNLVDGRRIYTARLQGPGDPAALAALLAPDELVVYRPAATDALSYRPTHVAAGGFDLGAPAASELGAIRALHEAIWGGGAGARYPADLHSVEFGPATSLVARRDGVVVGFLLGFLRFELPGLAHLSLPYRRDLGVESQVMGVAPEARRYGLAATLKREQGRQALAADLDLIHWTADPLQFPNAVLNFSKLRALAGEFYPAYYPFQNELNRVPASRLGLIWLPRSARGQTGLGEPPRDASRGLERFPGIVVINIGPEQLNEAGNAPWIAIDIPPDWTGLQRDDLATAARWRTTTDTLLAHYLGFTSDRYLITDTATDGVHCYLVAQRFDEALLLP